MTLLPRIVLLAALCLLCACERPSFQTDDLAAAQEAAGQRDWAQVARLLQRYLRDESDAEKRWTAWNLLVQASQHMGENAWANDYLESMLQEYGGDSMHSASILRQLGASYEKTRQWDKASQAWLRLLDVDELAPNEAALLYRRMGLFHQQAQNLAQAEDMFDMCVEQAATPALLSECEYYLADTYATDGHIEDALSHVAAALAVKDAPSDIRGRALLLQGDMLEQQGNREEAARAFTAALPLHPNPPVVQSRLDHLKKKPAALPPARLGN